MNRFLLAGVCALALACVAFAGTPKAKYFLANGVVTAVEAEPAATAPEPAPTPTVRYERVCEIDAFGRQTCRLVVVPVPIPVPSPAPAPDPSPTAVTVWTTNDSTAPAPECTECRATGIYAGPPGMPDVSFAPVAAGFRGSPCLSRVRSFLADRPRLFTGRFLTALGGIVRR